MQCGAGARQEWVGKRLVALKRMKKPWPGGWEECRRLPELESLRHISHHPNIISLYDYFLMPTTKELYFVFECMEGNLYQLIKSRKGRPLAGGLVSSIFYQVVSGLHHIHKAGYFHRDMKPENLLVTTTGLHYYPSTNPRAPPQQDVAVIVKLADFGLARKTASRPPYTEYVSTRWYRAPEVLLRSRDYSNPVDMWALGTIMAELVNLRPMFPGQGEIDQVALICKVLGNPCGDYGVDERGVAIGGGEWNRGLQLARDCRFVFPMVCCFKLALHLFSATCGRAFIRHSLSVSNNRHIFWVRNITDFWLWHFLFIPPDFCRCGAGRCGDFVSPFPSSNSVISVLVFGSERHGHNLDFGAALLIGLGL